MKVLTTKGPIELGLLDVADVVELCDNTRKVATEFRLAGELVRRDVAISMLMPVETTSVQGKVNG